MINQATTDTIHIDALAKLFSAICAHHDLAPDRRVMLLDRIRQFGSIALLPPLDDLTRLRSPSMHHDGTPIQLSASLTAAGTGGVRVAVEPGDLAEPISTQIITSLELLGTALNQLGWEQCTTTLSACVDAILPSEPTEMDTWWGGMWLGVVAHPRYTGIRAYFNLRSGDTVDRWRRIGRLFAALSASPVCPVIREIVSLTAESAMPVGVGLDLVDGYPAGIKVYLGVSNPSLDSIQMMMPHLRGRDNREMLPGFWSRIELMTGSLPPQSVTIAYDVRLDIQGIPEQRIKRYKVDVDVARVLPSDAQALDLVRTTAMSMKLRTKDLDAILSVVGPVDSTVRMFQYVGLGIGEGVSNLNVYIKPPGFSLVDRVRCVAEAGIHE